MTQSSSHRSNMDSQKTVAEVLAGLIQQQESLRKELQQVSQAITSLRKILGVQKPNYHREGAVSSTWQPKPQTDSYNVLMSLSWNGSTTYSELQRACGLGSQTSIHTARLVKFNFLTRLDRGVYQLTDKGRAFVSNEILAMEKTAMKSQPQSAPTNPTPKGPFGGGMKI